jgi:methylated-DNA-[protein]-cysteine S-methyltransferase
MKNSDLEELQQEWKEMFQKTLPTAATTKSTAQVFPSFRFPAHQLTPDSQRNWPVHLDHCFARIILDHTVGIDEPWTEKIKSPAYMNMSKEQLQASIELGRQILDGKRDLEDLDRRSLELRGKGKGRKSAGEKRQREGVEDVESGDTKVKRPKSSLSKSGLETKSKYFKSTKPEGSDLRTTKSASDKNKEDLTPWLKKIEMSDKTTFQKKVLTTLCQVPRGQYTTYGAISKHLSSSPRAVGNALRNNPFAPQVPCHRVLASGGGLGGFHGSWGRNGNQGLHDDKKRKLLRDEGVKFDGKGRVVGRAWDEFK